MGLEADLPDIPVLTTTVAQVVLFMLLLLAGYVYVWRKGALDWGSDARTEN